MDKASGTSISDKISVQMLILVRLSAYGWSHMMRDFRACSRGWDPHLRDFPANSRGTYAFSLWQLSDDKSLNTEAQSIRTFADPKAKEFGMDPRNYYNKYRQISAEISAYINTYASETLGKLDDDEFGIEEYNQHKSELLDDLVERNKDEINIKIDTNE